MAVNEGSMHSSTQKQAIPAAHHASGRWRGLGVGLLQNGQITFERKTKDNSIQELTDLVVNEYRSAREQEQGVVG